MFISDIFKPSAYEIVLKIGKCVKNKPSKLEKKN